jgi:hypothetical protein
MLTFSEVTKCVNVSGAMQEQFVQYFHDGGPQLKNPDLLRTQSLSFTDKQWACCIGK